MSIFGRTGFQSVLPDARQGPLARDRHPPREPSQRDNLTFDEVVPAIRRKQELNLTFKQCSWFSTYRIHHRAAERFRARRCFLAWRRGPRPQPDGRAGNE